MPTIALTPIPAGEIKRAPLNAWAADIQAAVNGLDGDNFAAGALAATALLKAAVAGDSESRLIVQADGKLLFGSGSATGDVSLSRSAVSKLSLGSDDTLVLGSGGIEFSDATALTTSPLPWLIDINVFPTAISQTNWDTIQMGGSGAWLYGAIKVSTGVQNAEISWDVVLAAGTWTVELVHVKDTVTGIYSVQFDTVEKGTIDGYAAAPVPNTRSSVSGIAVPATAKVRLKLKMATKNASASDYYGEIQAIQLRRTA